MGRTVAVVGAAKAQRSEKVLVQVQEVLQREGGVAVTTVHGDDGLRAAVAGADRVVVLGGDGSVHEVVQALHARGAAGGGPEVAVVPMGTGNDLVRSVGIPLDVEEAALLALGGRARPLALLEDEDGGVVVNAVHVGVGARAARTAVQAQATKSVMHAAAYSASAVVAGLRAPGWHLAVEVDGEVLHDGDQPVLMVAVGLGRTIGGGAPVAPAADPLAGVPQVTVSRSTGWLARFGYAVALRQGRHHHRKDVLSHHAHDEVQVRVVGGERFGVVADGELAGPFRRRTWRVRRDAWRLVLPG